MANFDKVILNGTTYTIPSGGGGGTVDTQLSPTSTNAVQNKAIYEAVNVIKEWNVLGSHNLPIYVPKNAITEGTPFRFTIKDVYSYNGYIYLFFPILGNDNLSIFYRYDLNDLTSYEKWDTFGSDSDRFMSHMQNEKVLYDSTTGVFVFTASYNHKEGYSNFLYGNFRVAFDSTEYTDSDGNIANIVNFSYNEAEVAVKLTTPDATPVKTIVEGLGDNEIFIPKYWNVNNFGSEGDLYIQLNNYNILSGEYGTSTQTQQLLKYDTNSFKYDNNNGFTFDYKKAVEPDIAPEVNITDYDSYSSSESISIHTHDLTLAIDFGNSTGSTTFTLESEKNNTYEFMVEKHGGDINVTINSQGMYYYYKSLQFPSTSTTGIITFGNDAPFEELTTFAKSSGDSGVVNAIRIYNEVAVKNLDELFDDKQDTLVSGTNIKTINNESILGSGNITIQGGGSSYTAGEGIDITNDVISADTDEQNKVIASALVELHNDKADKQQLNNYQLKGDYVEQSAVDASIAAAVANYRTEAEALNVEKVDAAALTDLNARVTDLEQGGGGSGITGITMNGSAVTVTSGVANLGTVVTDKSDKQDTLVSGTNIKTINNESILGSGNITIGGGGASYTAGTNMEIVSSGGTDTINCTLPITTGTNGGVIIGDNECTSTGQYSISFGHNADNSGAYSLCMGSNSSNSGQMSLVIGSAHSSGSYNLIVGTGSYSTYNKEYTCAIGYNLNSDNMYQANFGVYNVSNHASNTFGDAGNTLFTIGNGYDYQSTHNHHNAFEVRQNGDIYIPDTDDTTDTSSTGYSTKPMLRLQDYIATIRSLVTRVTALETALGNISSSLDTINGEVI